MLGFLTVITILFSSVIAIRVFSQIDSKFAAGKILITWEDFMAVLPVLQAQQQEDGDIFCLVKHVPQLYWLIIQLQHPKIKW